MSGWRPKTTAYGGLPSITFEPRKPVQLGTEFKNGIECLGGSMAFQDIVMAPELQKTKKYFFVDNYDVNDPSSHKIRKTSLPGNPSIQAHTAEVLRQVSGAGVRPGGWVGGDAWFGSVMTCVEVMQEFDVHSTWIVKNNTAFFPMEALHSVLKARHGSRRAGHWVVMKTCIAGIDLVAMAYAWSQSSVAYFISSCGATEPSPFKYVSRFEDEWGRTASREIDRPQIAHFLYQYLPLVDEHNKQRQSLLCLEKRWLTKDPWHRLLCTMFGMAVVDMHRCYRYHRIKVKGHAVKAVNEVNIQKFTDYLCNDLEQWKYKQRLYNPEETNDMFSRVQGRNNAINRSITPSTAERNRQQGNPHMVSCFMCRKYQKEDGSNNLRLTSNCCKACHMPLCRESRVGMDGGREETCMDEHLSTRDPFFGCNQPHVKGSKVPARKKNKLWR
jgi:hypothetical protein